MSLDNLLLIFIHNSIEITLMIILINQLLTHFLIKWEEQLLVIPKIVLQKETVDKIQIDTSVGVDVTDIESNDTGTSVIIYTDRDHGLNPVTRVTIASAGSGYGNGSGGVENLYNVSLSGSLSGTGGLVQESP